MAFLTRAATANFPWRISSPNAGELRQLYVLSTHQNQRLGAKLFDVALAWMEQQCFARSYIGVWSENYGAQRFYGRYGFE